MILPGSNLYFFDFLLVDCLILQIPGYDNWMTTFYFYLYDGMTVKTQSVECIGQIEVEEWGASIEQCDGGLGVD
jgi:hypothetical protein